VSEDVSSAPALSDEKEKELLRRCRYSHDARWYMAVAQEFGVEAANRLNKRVCQALGKAEMRRLVKALGVPMVEEPPARLCPKVQGGECRPLIAFQPLEA
jgi:hypothetical protein